MYKTISACTNKLMSILVEMQRNFAMLFILTFDFFSQGLVFIEIFNSITWTKSYF
jgi:hypothetical protein